MQSTSGKSIGHYQLLDLIGSGGMASVYQAFDTKFERHVAIKLMHPQYLMQSELRQRFVREAQASARLHHPGIIEVYDCSSADEQQPYIVMELVRGPTLDQLLGRWREEGRQLPWREAANFVLRLAEAIATAHKLGVLHRDLKPANILLKTRWPAYSGEMLAYDPVINDFGLARLDDGVAITQTGVSIGGTPAYMAPEQIGDDPVDARCDVYSLGAIFYEMVTGKPPFALKTFIDALQQHVANPVPLTPPRELRPDLPAAIDLLIVETLERNRVLRLPSSQALVVRLTEILGQPTHKEAQPTASAGEGATTLVAATSIAVTPIAPVQWAPVPIATIPETETPVPPSVSGDSTVLIAAPKKHVLRRATVVVSSILLLVLVAPILWYFAVRLLGSSSIPAVPVVTSTVQNQPEATMTEPPTETAIASLSESSTPTDTTNASISLSPTLALETASEPSPTFTPTIPTIAVPTIAVPTFELLAPIIGPETSHPTQIRMDMDVVDWQVLRSLTKTQTTPLDALHDQPSTNGCQAHFPNAADGVDLGASVYFAYDETYLYVSFIVQDDGFVTNSDPLNYWQGDSLQLLLNMAEDGTGDDSGEQQLQITLFPGVSQAGDQPGATILEGLSPSTDARVYSEAQFAAIPTADGYFFEAALPWSTLSAATPASGQSFRILPSVNDNDTPTTLLRECTIALVSNNSAELPASWPLLILE